MSENSYVRCNYTSPDGLECDSWTKTGPLCAIHATTLSTSLAANGINKDPYLERRKKTQFNLEQATNGMDRAAKIQYLDQHIADIERVIEEQKAIVLTARALRQQELEGLTDEERKERRKLQLMKPQTEGTKRVKKESAAGKLGADMLAREKAISSLVKTGKTREQAIALLDA